MPFAESQIRNMQEYLIIFYFVVVELVAVTVNVAAWTILAPHTSVPRDTPFFFCAITVTASLIGRRLSYIRVQGEFGDIIKI